MAWFRKTDVHHVTIAGTNPHTVANEMDQENNPFSGDGVKPSVAQSIVSGNTIVGGIVEVWTPEHLTSAQERYLREHPNVIDTRHIWGGE
jgi:hypothetical protein